CVLNGPFDPSAAYVGWNSAGFTTEILGFQPMFLATGPLTFFVNVTALGLSPNIDTVATILRSVEAYIHVTLILDLPSVTTYAIVQDPGTVQLLVSNDSGATGVMLDGTRVADIPRSFYFESETNPAVFLADFDDGS